MLAGFSASIVGVLGLAKGDETLLPIATVLLIVTGLIYLLLQFLKIKKRMTVKRKERNSEDNMKIRILSPENLLEGRKIIRQFLPDQIEPYEKYYKKYSYYYLGCFLDNRLIGLSFGLPLWEMDLKQDQHFLLDGIAVLEEFRSLGYGSKLLKEWERIVFSTQALKKIGLGTEGEKACRFYECNGYHRYGYLSFKGVDDFDESNYLDHPLYLRSRIDGDTVIIYLKGLNYNEEEEQKNRSELNLDDLVFLYEYKI